VLASQRQQIITEEVHTRGSVRVRELAELLEVSEMTVRRDLDLLAARGDVHKVHGGASRPTFRSTEEPEFAVKRTYQQAEKAAIAAEAASLVRPGDAVGITGGSTTWMLCQHLRRIPDITIVTNSLSVANGLSDLDDPSITVVITGGSRTKSDALVGPVAVSTIRSLRVDLVLMGVHGIAADPGFSTPNLAEAETNRAFVNSSDRFAVLADHTKWNVRGLATIAPIDRADILVTDRGLDVEARQVLGEQIVDLRVVGADNGN
jgi:DeoR/GlpR family transcriptional regulator of sugar metabolism